MKTVFILGAGASQLAGAPLMGNFLDVASDLLRKKMPGVVGAENEFEDVFDAIAELQGVHSKSYLDLDNVEIVFGAIEMGLLLKKLGGRDEESIKKLRDSLITLIYKTLECSTLFPVSDRRISPPRPYGSFMDILNAVKEEESLHDPHQFTFITFNYDLCMDVALNYLRGGYDYCLKPYENPGVSPLLKLHGSINWGLSDDGTIIPYTTREARFDFLHDSTEVFYNLGSSLNHKKHDGKPLSGPPVIVPPTWNKNSYHGQLSYVWSRAATELAEAENIFVIGYSLPETDSFFRYLYALGAESDTKIRNFVVINKDDTGIVENRFKDLIGRGIESRFRYIPSTFDDGLGFIRETLMNL
jgi:hypothetical protein